MPLHWGILPSTFCFAVTPGDKVVHLRWTESYSNALKLHLYFYLLVDMNLALGA